MQARVTDVLRERLIQAIRQATSQLSSLSQPMPFGRNMDVH
jgi:hypothetical protein